MTVVELLRVIQNLPDRATICFGEHMATGIRGIRGIQVIVDDGYTYVYLMPID